MNASYFIVTPLDKKRNIKKATKLRLETVRLKTSSCLAVVYGKRPDQLVSGTSGAVSAVSSARSLLFLYRFFELYNNL